MKIAITSTGKSLEDEVVKSFEEAQYLLIYNTDDQTAISWESSKDPEGIDLVNCIKTQGCEGVITGELEEKAFYAIADEGITRFKGDGIKVREAIELMEKRELEYIRDYKGAEPGHHHH